MIRYKIDVTHRLDGVGHIDFIVSEKLFHYCSRKKYLVELYVFDDLRTYVFIKPAR